MISVEIFLQVIVYSAFGVGILANIFFFFKFLRYEKRLERALTVIFEIIPQNFEDIKESLSDLDDKTIEISSMQDKVLKKVESEFPKPIKENNWLNMKKVFKAPGITEDDNGRN